MQKSKAVIIFISVIFILCVLLTVDENIIDVTFYSYNNKKLPESFNDFTIVHLSDLHNKSFGKNQKNLMKKIGEINPDIIVYTGDIISSKDETVKNAEIFIKECLKICPVYYVEGNHDKYSNTYNRFFQYFLKGSGVHVLRNQFEKITVHNESITVCGIQDYVFATNYGYASSQRIEAYEKWIKETIPDDESFKLVLSHRPEFFEEYLKNGADLVLTGHAHGAQVILPFVGGVFAPNQGMFPKWYNGKYNMGECTMIVNRGLGNSIIFPRVNNSPEIVVIKLN